MKRAAFAVGWAGGGGGGAGREEETRVGRMNLEQRAEETLVLNHNSTSRDVLSGLGKVYRKKCVRKLEAAELEGVTARGPEGGEQQLASGS